MVIPPVGAEAMPTVSFKRRRVRQVASSRCLFVAATASRCRFKPATLYWWQQARRESTGFLQPLLRLALPLHRCTAGGVDATLSETERYNARPVRADLLMAEALRLAKRPRAIDDWTGDHDYAGFFFT